MRADSDPRRYRCSLLGERRGRSTGHRGRTRRERDRFRPPRGGAGQRCSTRGNTRFSIRYSPAASPGARTPYATRGAFSEQRLPPIPAPDERHPDPGPPWEDVDGPRTGRIPCGGARPAPPRGARGARRRPFDEGTVRRRPREYRPLPPRKSDGNGPRGRTRRALEVVVLRTKEPP